MKILRTATIALGVLLVIGLIGVGIARLVINGPIGPLAGGALAGTQQTAPADWSFTNAHTTIALEVGPDDPHSVTVVCFLVDGELHIPAMDGAEKDWTQTAVADGRATIRVADNLYPVQLVRVEGETEREAGFISAGEKYPQLAEREGDDLPDSVWLFRAERRSR